MYFYTQEFLFKSGMKEVLGEEEIVSMLCDFFIIVNLHHA